MIADRGNQRLVSYPLAGDGAPQIIGRHILTSPSSLAIQGDSLIVTELHGALVRLDTGGNEIGRFGDNDGHTRPGWPNARVSGETVAPALRPAVLNSPHGITTDAHGNLYLSEWCIGGRTTAFIKQPA